ncbi:OLC1v1016099C1 [Oldenlandia corymbosa var. corymbosa]|uniref:OLC1v1016099C1 n=1 Tax=Oldenlandia corymbosa var. corymbosa TaxID=529605 RepID=A0AAV1E6M5_OLDCO|nr:OLC1v1016099C1 [Oldenlandia corymbosa var. corymbosa]
MPDDGLLVEERLSYEGLISKICMTLGWDPAHVKLHLSLILDSSGGRRVVKIKNDSHVKFMNRVDPMSCLDLYIDLEDITHEEREASLENNVSFGGFPRGGRASTSRNRDEEETPLFTQDDYREESDPDYIAPSESEEDCDVSRESYFEESDDERLENEERDCNPLSRRHVWAYERIDRIASQRKGVDYLIDETAPLAQQWECRYTYGDAPRSSTPPFRDQLTSLHVEDFRFNPTEEELVSHYLKNKILGIPLTDSDSQFLIDMDMYGKDATPWELFCSDQKNRFIIPWLPSFDPSGNVKVSEAVLYVLTKLSNVGKTEKSEKKQKNRVAGCGTWHGNRTKEPVTEADENGEYSRVIGFRRSFTFRSSTHETVGQWNMMEYNINPVAHNINPAQFDWEDIVLCKIKRDDSKSSLGGRLVSRKRKFSGSDTDTKSRKMVIMSSPSTYSYSSSSQISSYSEDERQSMNNNSLQGNCSNGSLLDSSANYDPEALQETIPGLEDSETVVENYSINEEDLSNSDLWFELDEFPKQLGLGEKFKPIYRRLGRILEAPLSVDFLNQVDHEIDFKGYASTVQSVQHRNEELIGHFLRNTILRQPLSPSESRVVIYKEMYGKEATPWELFHYEVDENNQLLLPWVTNVDPLGKIEADIDTESSDASIGGRLVSTSASSATSMDHGISKVVAAQEPSWAASVVDNTMNNSVFSSWGDQFQQQQQYLQPVMMMPAGVVHNQEPVNGGTEINTFLSSGQTHHQPAAGLSGETMDQLYEPQQEQYLQQLGRIVSSEESMPPLVDAEENVFNDKEFLDIGDDFFDVEGIIKYLNSNTTDDNVADQDPKHHHLFHDPTKTLSNYQLPSPANNHVEDTLKLKPPPPPPSRRWSKYDADFGFLLAKKK